MLKYKILKKLFVLNCVFVCCVYAVCMLCVCCVYAVCMLCVCCVYGDIVLKCKKHFITGGNNYLVRRSEIIF